VHPECSTDGALTQHNALTASTPAPTRCSAWTAPAATTACAKIRSVMNADAAATAAAAAAFTIKSSLTLTAPNTGEVWVVGTSQNITWTKTGTIANVKLDYSTDGGTTYPNLIASSTAAAAGTYAWTIPDIASTNVKVRVTNTADTTVS